MVGAHRSLQDPKTRPGLCSSESGCGQCTGTVPSTISVFPQHKGATSRLYKTGTRAQSSAVLQSKASQQQTDNNFQITSTDVVIMLAEDPTPAPSPAPAAGPTPISGPSPVSAPVPVPVPAPALVSGPTPVSVPSPVTPPTPSSGAPPVSVPTPSQGAAPVQTTTPADLLKSIADATTAFNNLQVRLQLRIVLFAKNNLTFFRVRQMPSRLLELSALQWRLNSPAVLIGNSLNLSVYISYRPKLTDI